MSDFRKITGLWRNRSGKGYSGGLKDEVTIPPGARLFVFKIPEDKRKPNGPELELVWAPQGERE